MGLRGNIDLILCIVVWIVWVMICSDNLGYFCLLLIVSVLMFVYLEIMIGF